MTGRIHGLFAAAAFALYAAAGAAAFAQPPRPAAPGGAHVGMAAGDHGMESPAEHAQRLRDLLQLKPAQEPALQAFVGAIDSAHRGMMGGMQAMSGASRPATTPERLDRMQQMMTQHQAAMSAVIDATRRFYAQLDPAQKRAFDALPPMAMHRRMMMGGPGDGPGMMGGMGPMGGATGGPMGGPMMAPPPAPPAR